MVQSKGIIWERIGDTKDENIVSSINMTPRDTPGHGTNRSSDGRGIVMDRVPSVSYL